MDTAYNKVLLIFIIVLVVLIALFIINNFVNIEFSENKFYPEKVSKTPRGYVIEGKGYQIPVARNKEEMQSFLDDGYKYYKAFKDSDN